jgi:hypothetical protein
VKEPSDENQSAMKLSQRAMPEGDNPSFWDEFIKFTFSWQFNSY